MNMEAAQQQMIRQQIRTSDVHDTAVLATIESLNRADFVPDEFVRLACADCAIPIARGEFMLTPMLEGRLLQALSISKQDSVLEIGTGSGYLTACLAGLAGTVTSIDIQQDFVDMATERLQALDIVNATIQCMDMTVELPEGRFDAIVVGGSMPQLDQRLVDKLSANGRMFVVLGKAPVMTAVIVHRRNAAFPAQDTLFETELEPLRNVRLSPEFAF